MKLFLNLLAEVTSSAEASTSSSTSSSSSGGTTQALMNLLKGPTLWIILGALVALIIVVWLIRRVVKAQENASVLIKKKGQIVAIVGKEEGEIPSKFAAPFVTTISSPIQRKNNVYSADNLLINDGPDKLYRIQFSLGYDVTDVKLYAAQKDNFIADMLSKTLRQYAYEGNADKLLRSYVEEEKNLVALLNKAYEGKGVEVSSFTIASIAPVTASAK